MYLGDFLRSIALQRFSAIALVEERSQYLKTLALQSFTAILQTLSRFRSLATGLVSERYQNRRIVCQLAVLLVQPV